MRCTMMERNTKATVADHKVPHYGNPQLFWDPDNLQSLCREHHDTKSREEQGNKTIAVLGADGWPVGG